MKIKKSWAAAAALLALSGASQAALHDRGNGMIYDDTRNITWLADMNFAKTQYTDSSGAQGDVDGKMTWSAAAAWADNLSFGGYSDWRLPTLNPSDTTCSNSMNPGGGFGAQYFGSNCTGGELSGLFVTELGFNPALVTGTPAQMANRALFKNFGSPGYWSGTPYAPDSNQAWQFSSQFASQSFSMKSTELFAVAVRPGDVAVVPEPQAYALMLAGLGAVMVAARRRPR